MKKSVGLTLIPAGLLLFCVGCQSMKQMLNDEPRRRAARARAAQTQNRDTQKREVFPGSSRHSRRPFLLEGELNEQERRAFRATTQENRLPGRDYNQIRREEKTASDWVFGR